MDFRVFEIEGFKSLEEEFRRGLEEWYGVLEEGFQGMRIFDLGSIQEGSDKRDGEEKPEDQGLFILRGGNVFNFCLIFLR